LLIGLFGLIFPAPVSGQSPDYPFKNNEYALYGAYYNWHFVWIQSGDVVFTADTIPYEQQKSWHLKAVGKTFKAYDLLYEVRDTFEVFCKADSFSPIYSRRVLNHARKNTVHEYSFNYATRKIETLIHQSKKPVYKAALPIQENTFDLLTGKWPTSISATSEKKT